VIHSPIRYIGIMIFFAIIGIAMVATLCVVGIRVVLSASEKFTELNKSNEALKREIEDLKQAKRLT